jgi:hypothetical protein
MNTYFSRSDCDFRRMGMANSEDVGENVGV